MNIDKGTVLKIAHLARLEVKPDEIDGLSSGLQQILTWMEKLNDVDTTGVEPLRHMSKEVNAWREDLVKNQMERISALANSPKPHTEFFTVPKVIG